MPDIRDELRQLLDYFEQHVDVAHSERVRDRYRRTLRGETMSLPPLSCYVAYEGGQFRPYPVCEIIDNPEKMLVNELLVGFTSLYHALDRRDDTPMAIRANLGTGIIASMFGAEIQVLEDNPPWVRPLGDAEKLARIAEEPLPEVTAGLGAKMLDHYAFFQDVLADYPRCAAGIDVTLPDLQGPFDTVEMLWGSEIYVAMQLQPESVLPLLDRVAEQMVRVFRALEPIAQDSLQPLGNFQQGTAVRGRVLIRNDSIVLVSPKTYAGSLMSSDARLAQDIGVAVHFCGNGAHQVDNLLGIDGVAGLDFGQPEMMDIAAIYEKTSSRGVPVARLRPTREELISGEAAASYPRLATLCYTAKDAADAEAVTNAYYATQLEGA